MCDGTFEIGRHTRRQPGRLRESGPKPFMRLRGSRHPLVDIAVERTGIARLLAELTQHGIAVRDVATKQSNLEEIFMSLVEDRQEASA